MFEDEEVVRVYVPPGWPASVRPPGSPGWQRTATAYLFDVCPADYRGYPLLQRHPVVLARFAKECVASQLSATRASLTGVRTDLGPVVDTSTVEAAVALLQQEEARLTRVGRGVALVSDALRDVRFKPRL